MREVSDAAVIEAMSLAFKLTAREAEVLYWVVKGKTNRDIGDILGTSPATVKKHLERVFAKLGVETRTAAAGDGDESHPAAASAVRGLVCVMPDSIRHPSPPWIAGRARNDDSAVIEAISLLCQPLLTRRTNKRTMRKLVRRFPWRFQSLPARRVQTCTD